MTAIDPFFPCLSPDSATPRTIPLRLQLSELERELHQRRNSYPARVDKGRMHAHDAERGIDAMRALVDDMQADVTLEAMFDRLPAGQNAAAEDWARYEAQRAKADASLRPFRWSEIVAVLQREILLRRRYYPQWVTGRTLDPVAARHQLERMEAVHYRWWRLGEHWMPDDLQQLRGRTDWTDAERQNRRLRWREHEARFDPASDRGAYLSPEEQQEMAL